MGRTVSEHSVSPIDCCGGGKVQEGLFEQQQGYAHHRVE